MVTAAAAAHREDIQALARAATLVQAREATRAVVDIQAAAVVSARVAFQEDSEMAVDSAQEEMEVASVQAAAVSAREVAVDSVVDNNRPSFRSTCEF
jgi:hypothetical protein